MRAGGISEPSRKRQPKSSPKSSKRKERSTSGQTEEAPPQETPTQGQDEAPSSQPEVSKLTRAEEGSQESIPDGATNTEADEGKCEEDAKEGEQPEVGGEIKDSPKEIQNTLEVPCDESGIDDQEISDDAQERQVISVMTEQSIDESEVKVW